MTPDQLRAALDTAVARLRGGRTHEARQLLEQVVATAPKSADAHRLLGQTRKALHDLPGAAAALNEAVRLDRKNAESWVALAGVQQALGKPAEAERAWRAALALNRRNVAAATGLSDLLLAQGQAEAALQLTTPLYPGSTDPALIAQHAAALKAAGRKAESLAAYERWAELQPASPIGDHNVAAALGDLGRNPEAEAAVRRAFAKGARAPETFLVHAHALQGQDRLDEAESAYRDALRGRPAYLEAHRELAQLIWMRTEDVAAATTALDQAIAATDDGMLMTVKAQLLAHAGREEEAYQTLTAALAHQPGDGGLHLAASQQAVKARRPAEAMALAERAMVLLPDDDRAEAVLVEACLAVGDAARAAGVLDGLRRRKPEDQGLIAMQATAWRLLGDPRYAALYDYAAFVHGYRIDAPRGWSSLDAYLADLAEGLRALHVTRTHPIGQSLRHGSQTNQSLLNATHPAVAAFREAIDGPIRAHLARLGQGKDVLRRRNRGGYAIAGIWSVQLRPGGFHIDHVHPEGWLSSACYIALPRAVEGEGRQGWIRFGQPGTPTRPSLDAEHYVKPEPGLLVLFPSYIWHGTVPFEGQEPRLTVAFDLLPKTARP